VGKIINRLFMLKGNLLSSLILGYFYWFAIIVGNLWRLVRS